MRQRSSGALAEVTPVRGDDEKQTADCKRYTRDNRPSGAKLEPRQLCGCEPDPGEQHQQEPDLGEAHARVMRETED